MTQPSITVSVVIPTYNEQARIADTLYTVKNYLCEQPYNSEIIIVDDGSDDTTADVVRVIDIYQREFKHQPDCRLMTNHTNSGKGYCVALGCSQARGGSLSWFSACCSTWRWERMNHCSWSDAGGCTTVSFHSFSICRV